MDGLKAFAVKNRNVFRFVAAFAALVMLYSDAGTVVSVLKQEYWHWDILLSQGFALISSVCLCIALFINKPRFVGVALTLNVLPTLLSFLQQITVVIDGYYGYISFLLLLFVRIVSKILLCIAVFLSDRKAVSLGAAALILEIVYFAIVQYSILYFIVNLVLYAALTLYAAANNAKKRRSAANTVPASAASPIEQLAKLQDLLANGIITQEEFNAKKRSILHP